jgi:hypothetical protein
LGRPGVPTVRATRELQGRLGVATVTLERLGGVKGRSGVATVGLPGSPRVG